MTPRKLNVMFFFYSYGGNGGISSIVPQISRWWGMLTPKLKEDERIGEVKFADISETPVTMSRNMAVQMAKAADSDVIVMVDSDNVPDMYHATMSPRPDPKAKPFFQSSFDFLYDHYDKGPVMVGAPYAGPPPEECVYVFEFASGESHDPNQTWRIDLIPRNDAARRAGIEPVAAIATGLLMIDMRIFDYLKPPYFFYEYTDQYQQAKASTEDVVFTRNANLHTFHALKRQPVHCNWDAWAGHWKPKLVGKPVLLPLESIHSDLVDAVRNGHSVKEKLTFVQEEKGFDITPALRGVPSLNGG